MKKHCNFTRPSERDANGRTPSELAKTSGHLRLSQKIDEAVSIDRSTNEEYLSSDFMNWSREKLLENYQKIVQRFAPTNKL